MAQQYVVTEIRTVTRRIDPAPPEPPLAAWEKACLGAVICVGTLWPLAAYWFVWWLTTHN